MTSEADPNPQIGTVAEATVVGAAILLPKFWDHVERLPDFEDFEQPYFAALWAATIAARKRGPISRASVVLQLREMQYKETDCLAALSTVKAEYLTLGDALESVRFLMDRRLKRQATTLLSESLNGLATASAPRDLLERHEKAISDLVLNHAGASGWNPAFAADVEESIFKVNDNTTRIPTGWKDVDAKIRGWPRRKMSILAGRPSMGKSLLGISAAKNLAGRGLGTAFISLEMDADEVWLRLAADLAYQGSFSPEYEKVQAGEATPVQMRAMNGALEVIRDMPLTVDERSGLKVVEMHRWLRRLQRHYRDQGNQLDAVFVDYLGLARPDKDRQGSKTNEVSDISGDLVALAKELDVCLIALSQLSRETEKRPNPRPQLSDLRDSGSLEQDAAMVGLLFRPAYYYERKAAQGDLSEDDIADARRKKHVLDIDFQKNRNGKTGNVSVFCNVGCNAVRDLSHHVNVREAA